MAKTLHRLLAKQPRWHQRWDLYKSCLGAEATKGPAINELMQQLWDLPEGASYAQARPLLDSFTSQVPTWQGTLRPGACKGLQTTMEPLLERFCTTCTNMAPTDESMARLQHLLAVLEALPDQHETVSSLTQRARERLAAWAEAAAQNKFRLAVTSMVEASDGINKTHVDALLSAYRAANTPTDEETVIQLGECVRPLLCLYASQVQGGDREGSAAAAALLGEIVKERALPDRADVRKRVDMFLALGCKLGECIACSDALEAGTSDEALRAAVSAHEGLFPQLDTLFPAQDDGDLEFFKQQARQLEREHMRGIGAVAATHFAKLQEAVKVGARAVVASHSPLPQRCRLTTSPLSRRLAASPHSATSPLSTYIEALAFFIGRAGPSSNSFKFSSVSGGYSRVPRSTRQQKQGRPQHAACRPGAGQGLAWSERAWHNESTARSEGEAAAQ